MTIFQCNLSSRLLRIKQLRIFFFLCCYFPCLTIAALTPQEIASNAFPSVVVVIAQNSSGEDFAYGSGFYLAPDLVATNLHVIEGAVKVRIRPIGSDIETDVTGFTAADYDNDLVLLKTQVKDGKPLIIADDSTVSIGDDVYVIGNPQGLEGTFSRGMVSGKRDVNNRKILQITAPISQGSSGGPVLSEKGEIIGIAVSYVAEGQNLNFAIPSFYLQTIMKKQHDNRPLAIFEAKEAKKVSPSSFDTKQVPVAFENVLLYIGMPIEEAIEKLKTNYFVNPVTDSSMYLVIQKKGFDSHAAGSLEYENGKLIKVTRNLGIGNTTVPDEVALMFKSLVLRLLEYDQAGTPICIVKKRYQEYEYNNAKHEDIVFSMNFGDYEVHIAVAGIDGEYQLYLDETIEK